MCLAIIHLLSSSFRRWLAARKWSVLSQAGNGWGMRDISEISAFPDKHLIFSQVAWMPVRISRNPSSESLFPSPFIYSLRGSSAKWSLFPLHHHRLLRRQMCKQCGSTGAHKRREWIAAHTPYEVYTIAVYGASLAITFMKSYLRVRYYSMDVINPFLQDFSSL